MPIASPLPADVGAFYGPQPNVTSRSRKRRSNRGRGRSPKSRLEGPAPVYPVAQPPIGSPLTSGGNKTTRELRSTTFVEQHLDIARERIEGLCRRERMSIDEAEDFRSTAILKLLQKSGRLQELFEGRSNVATYLDSVLANILRDYRISKWGKWRPSRTAERLGSLALNLERQIYRNRLSPQDAVQIIAMDRSTRAYCGDARQFEEELWEIVSQLPTRVDRRMVVDTDALEELVDGEAESPLELQQALREIERLKRTLLRALDQLSAKQKNVLQLRYAEGLSFGEIATRTGVRTDSLYRMVSRTLKKLRREVTAEGLCADTALQAQASGASDFCVEWLFVTGCDDTGTLEEQ